MEYMVVTAENKFDLLNTVDHAIRNLWTPQGGVSISYSPRGRTTWAQAMVRKDEGSAGPKSEESV